MSGVGAGIDERSTVELARELVRVESVNPSLVPGGSGEGEIAELVAGWLDDAGLEVEVREPRPGRPSVVGRLRGRGEGPSLMLNAHMDTVGVDGMEDPFSARLEDGRIHGRGAYDMKGALAACMTAAAAVADAALPPGGDLLVAAVADEEDASLGTRDVLRDHRPDGAVVTEPTGLELCVAHKGFVWVEIRTRGRAAHGSRPDLGVDANRAMGRVLVALDGLEEELRGREPHPLLGHGSLHVGVLEGGSGVSTYADGCRARVERRTLPGEDPEAVVQEIRDAIRRAGAGDGGPRAGMEVQLVRSAFTADTRGAVASALEAAAREELGREIRRVGEGPWMDSALLREAGTDTVVFGPAGEGAHADREWVDASSVVRLARVLAGTAVRYCGRA